MRLHLAALLVVFLSSVVHAGTKPVIKDTTATALVQKALLYLGGNGLSSFQDVTATGTTTLYGDSGSVTYPITLMASGEANVRSSIQEPSGTNVYVSDGTTSCLNGQLASGPEDRRLAMLATRIDFVPALSIVREYADQKIQIQYLGTDSVEGNQVDVVSISILATDVPPTFDSLSATQRLFYFDRQSSVLRKVQYQAIVDNLTAPGPKVEVYYSNYQTVNGFAVPFRQATYVDGRLGTEVLLSTVTFNNAIPASEFAINCEVANAN
jgi:outer membrane lipoprotein-sorting protein